MPAHGAHPGAAKAIEIGISDGIPADTLLAALFWDAGDEEEAENGSKWTMDFIGFSPFCKTPVAARLLTSAFKARTLSGARYQPGTCQGRSTSGIRGLSLESWVKGINCLSARALVFPTVRHVMINLDPRLKWRELARQSILKSHS